MSYQISLFDIINNRKQFKIDKPIRLIELFAGYGSQHFALDYLEVNFESWKICEWAIKSIQAYKDAHFSTDNTDYSKELTRDQVEEYLFNKGISSNYNDPMTLEQIKRLGEGKARVIYNNIIATHNLVSVVNCKAHQKPFEKVLGNKSISPTLTARGAGENHSGMILYSDTLEDTSNLQNECLKIKEATKKGYTEAQDGDGVYINRPHQKRGVVQKGMIQTIKTSPDIGVVVKDEIKPKLVGGIGDKKSNGGTQYYQQDRIYDSESIAMAHPANLPGGSYKYLVENKISNGLRIRKLSPLECWRLMGVKDEDFYKIAKNQSN